MVLMVVLLLRGVTSTTELMLLYLNRLIFLQVHSLGRVVQVHVIPCDVNIAMSHIVLTKFIIALIRLIVASILVIVHLIEPSLLRIAICELNLGSKSVSSSVA